jgi:hypothetical protein
VESVPPRRDATLVRWSVWILLASGCLVTKTPVSDCWILLDFLGFSRPNRDLLTGYMGFSWKKFSCAFSGLERRWERRHALEAMRKRKIVHGASLISFPIFSKALSTLIAVDMDLELNVDKAVMAGLAPAIHAAPPQIYRRAQTSVSSEAHDETAVFSWMVGSSPP